MNREKEDIICISSRGREPGLKENGKDLVSAEQRIRERRGIDQQREMKAAATKNAF